jgi:hypothetical protein
MTFSELFNIEKYINQNPKLLNVLRTDQIRKIVIAEELIEMASKIYIKEEHMSFNNSLPLYYKVTPVEFTNIFLYIIHQSIQNDTNENKKFKQFNYGNDFVKMQKENEAGNNDILLEKELNNNNEEKTDDEEEMTESQELEEKIFHEESSIKDFLMRLRDFNDIVEVKINIPEVLKDIGIKLTKENNYYELQNDKNEFKNYKILFKKHPLYENYKKHLNECFEILEWHKVYQKLPDMSLSGYRRVFVENPLLKTTPDLNLNNRGDIVDDIIEKNVQS